MLIKQKNEIKIRAPSTIRKIINYTHLMFFISIYS